MKPPLVIELFAGCFGWSAGWLEQGGRAVGFDIEHLPHHGDVPTGADLVLQDVLTLHGSQFKSADLILASPPCQAYSYRAMPWNKSWQDFARWEDDGGPVSNYVTPDPIGNSLFHVCFRIQREASEAAGRHIPLVVENVKGAQRWVGRAAWHFGNFYLWGDVPALMPFSRHTKTVAHANKRDGHSHTRHLTNQRESDAVKVAGINWSGHGTPGYKPQGFNVTAAQRYRDSLMGVKNGKDWFGSGENCSLQRRQSSRSDSRKAASARIAKIPFPLSSHIAKCYWPERRAA